MFWGLILEPGKRYSQQVAKAFHVSMATLEVANDESLDNVPVMLEYEDGREYMLCNLHKVRQMQCPLDLNFKEGEKVGFYSGLGKSRVHLTGYVLEDIEDDEMESSDEEEEEMPTATKSQKRKEPLTPGAGAKKIKLTDAFDGEDDDDEDDGDYEVEEEEGDSEKAEEEEGDSEKAEEEEEDDDEDDDDDDEEEEDSDGLTSPMATKGKLQPTLKEKSKKKGNQNEITPNKKKADQSLKTPKEQNGIVKTPHSEKKNKKSGETSKPGTPQGKTPQKKVLQGGVAVEDTVVGNGPVAKAGGKVTVYYVGRLQQNNKQFDSTSSGPGFKFTLGRGEVIKGWDIGVPGMRVGGKRTITIPAHLAYGKKGQPPVIPPNSILVFDVELRGYN